MKILLIGLLPPDLGGPEVGGIASIMPHWATHLAGINGNEVYFFAPVVRQIPADMIPGVTVLPWLSKDRNLFSLVKRYGILNLGLALFDVFLSRLNYFNKIFYRYGLRYSRLYFEIKKATEIACPDIIINHVFYEEALTTTAAVRAVDPSIPIINSVHGVQLNARSLEDLSNKEKSYYLVRARDVFTGSDYIAFSSTYNLEYSKKYNLLDGLKNYGVVTDGVDTTFFKSGNKELAIQTLGLELNYRHILFVGSLLPRKGCHLLIQAFSRVVQTISDIKLIIIGDGPERENLRQQTRNLGIEKQVYFTGTISNPNEFYKWYHACDLYVLPSKSEGLAISILEAMSSGIPVISCYPEIGCYENLCNNETCLLTEYGDIDQLVIAIQKMLSDPDMALRLTGNATRLMREEFDWKVRARAMYELAKNVIKQKKQSFDNE